MERDTLSWFQQHNLNKRFQQWFPDFCMHLRYCDPQTKSWDGSFQNPAKAKHTHNNFHVMTPLWVGHSMFYVVCILEINLKDQDLSANCWSCGSSRPADEPHKGSEHLQVCTLQFYSHSIGHSKPDSQVVKSIRFRCANLLQEESTENILKTKIPATSIQNLFWHVNFLLLGLTL